MKMDNFGRNILVPSAVCGLAFLGYQIYKRNQDTLTSLTKSQGTPVKLVSDGDPTTPGHQARGLQTPESPVYTDGGGPSLDGNENDNSSPNEMRTTQIPVQAIAETKTPKLSSEAVQKIHGLENNFFKGLDQTAKLTDDELGNLAKLLIKNTLSSSYKFLDILLAMREQGYFSTRCYKETLLRVLKLASISPNDSTLDHLDMLDENIQIIISEDLQKGTETMFEYDIVLVFTDDDHSEAVEFTQCVERKFEALNVKIASYSDIDANTTELRGLENTFQSALYVFILVSLNFKDDDLNRYIGETSLITSFRAENAKWRVIPIWLHRDIKNFKNCPRELATMKGIDYFHINENKCEYSIKKVWENLERLIKNGRRKYKKI